MKFYCHILPKEQQLIWPHLKGVSKLGFTLYGGTALAIQLGHRISVDFDFFSERPLDDRMHENLLDSLSFLKRADLIQSMNNTRTWLTNDGVKFSFFGGIGLGRVGQPIITPDDILRLASLKDLFGFKLAVVLKRAELKDYMDIAAICRFGLNLSDGLGYAKALYTNQFSEVFSLKALTFFSDGNLSKLNEEDCSTLIAAVNSVNLKTIPKISIVSYNLSGDDEEIFRPSSPSPK
jgi:hypothetical protein